MSEKFVKVAKDGEELLVHPSTVESHKEAGWKVIETVEVEEKPKAKEPKSPAEPKAPAPKKAQDNPAEPPAAEPKE